MERVKDCLLAVYQQVPQSVQSVPGSHQMVPSSQIPSFDQTQESFPPPPPNPPPEQPQTPLIPAQFVPEMPVPPCAHWTQ